MKYKIHFHPFLFTLFSILSYWVTNKNFIFLKEIWRTVVIGLGGVGIVYLILWFVLQKREKSAVLTSLLAVAFLSYGHGFYWLEGKIPYLDQPVPYFVLWLSLLLIGLYVVIRVCKQCNLLNSYLNWVSLILVVFPLWQVMQALLSPSRQSVYLANVDANAAPIPIVDPNQRPPDIYYIILDGYGRGDILAELYSFDNSGFLDALQNRGFYVADQSHTNYVHTDHSLIASLSGNYLDSARLDPASADRTILHGYPNKDAHLQRLRQLGYQIIALQDADALLQLYAADEIISVNHTLNNFELGFHDLTLGRFWSPTLYEYTQWEIVRSQLGALENLPANPERPHFVFAHLLSPHPPFVFDANGNFVATNLYMAGDGSDYGGTVQEYISGYTGQVRYLNARLIKIIDHLLDVDTNRQPVIILQGDHGPGAYLNWESLEKTCLRERLAIFNAYYFPSEESRSKLYSSISPVNSLRLAFDQVLGQPMDLLDDRSYFSTWESPYDFIEVTGSKDTCSPLQ